MQPSVRTIAVQPLLIRLLLCLAAIVCGVLVLGPSPADASHVQCGDTLTADATLDTDLLDCPNNGLVIGVDGVTLHLNGHLIDGDATEFADCPQREICDAGVVIDGHDGVTVRDGSVREFGIGVLVSGSRESRIVGISSSNHEFFGAVLGGSTRSEVRDSSLSHNVAPEGDGLGLFGSDDNKIVGNSIEDNPGPGIHIEDSTANLVKRNRMAKNGPAMLVEGDDNEIRRNRIAHGGGILVVKANDNAIVANRISRASDALGVEKGSGNLVAFNTVIDARGNGIYLGLSAPPIGGGHNVVRRNLVRRSAEDGFHVYPKDDHSVLKRNVSVAAGDDGFEIETRTTRLKGNRARRSADVGILAP